MEGNTKRLIEKYDADYNKIASKESWTKDDITMMKDLQKLMYYIEVRCAMKEGNEYPGSEHMPDVDYNRNANGMSGRRYYGMNMNSSPSDHYYDNRYYDGEKEAVIHKLHRMLDKEDNPVKRDAIQDVLREFERK